MLIDIDKQNQISGGIKMKSVFWLFPIVFMIHEMEEIIGFRL